jgi:hypothetical protein
MRRWIILLVVAVLATNVSAEIDRYGGKISPPLKLLLSLHRAGVDRAPLSLQDLVAKEEINVSVQLAGPSNPAVWEGRGMRLRKLASGRWAGLGDVYGARMSWDEIEGWASDPGVLRIESDWRPGIVPCLDLSAPEVGADQCWEMISPQGFPITGQGQLVADFDTGIDVFHPMFFRPSGLSFNWLDVDSNGVLTPGVDCVDLDSNGVGIREEVLRFLDGQIYDPAHTFGSADPSNNDGIYQADWDWLYDDIDDDGQRDYGVSSGFNENTPGFGEPIFYCDDLNHNNTLDLGERLIQLGPSKIRAVVDGWSPQGPVVHRRGIDLISAFPDYNGHGTGVSGILVGGEPGRSKFCGLAPGADLLMGYTNFTWFTEYLPWVAEEGCKVLLYEFGGWVFNSLDGSTLEEYLLDSLAGIGVMQVTPSGNLNRGYKHCQLQIGTGESVPITVGAAQYTGLDPTGFYCTFLWRFPDTDLSVSLQDPYGFTLDLLGTDTTQYFGSWTVWSGTWVSPRGTAEYDFIVDGGSGPVTGDWEIIVHHPGGTAGFEVNGYIMDDVSSWGGGVEFTDFRSNMKTVTWPATADSAFVLGSYSTRGYEQYIGVGLGSIQSGQISQFSGRGPRIDGEPRLSVISPGNYDVYSTRSVYGAPFTHAGYRQFSGTSAAGPHVAASAILARQADTTITRIEIETLLEEYAFRDNFTGPQWNDSAGYGKVRIDDIVSYLGLPLAHGPVSLPTTLALTAFPNPFNAATALRVDLPGRQMVELTVWNLQGRKVADLYGGEMAAGYHRVTWDAAGLPSGVYWVSLKAGEQQTVQKVALVK